MWIFFFWTTLLVPSVWFFTAVCYSFDIGYTPQRLLFWKNGLHWDNTEHSPDGTSKVGESGGTFPEQGFPLSESDFWAALTPSSVGIAVVWLPSVAPHTPVSMAKDIDIYIWESKPLLSLKYHAQMVAIGYRVDCPDHSGLPWECVYWAHI